MSPFSSFKHQAWTTLWALDSRKDWTTLSVGLIGLYMVMMFFPSPVLTQCLSLLLTMMVLLKTYDMHTRQRPHPPRYLTHYVSFTLVASLALLLIQFVLLTLSVIALQWTLWTALLWVPIAGVSMWLSYVFRFVYVLSLVTSLPWSQLLRQAAALTKGHRWSLFLLDVSFIGWALLSLFTLGIGLLWYLPYYQLTQWAVFDALYSQKAESDTCCE